MGMVEMFDGRRGCLRPVRVRFIKNMRLIEKSI